MPEKHLRKQRAVCAMQPIEVNLIGKKKNAKLELCLLVREEGRMLLRKGKANIIPTHISQKRYEYECITMKALDSTVLPNCEILEIKVEKEPLSISLKNHKTSKDLRQPVGLEHLHKN